jgi:hypothetical protein
LIELLLLQKRDEKKYQGKEATRWDRGYRFHSFNVLLLWLTETHPTPST